MRPSIRFGFSVLNMDASLSNPYNVPQHLADPEHYVECDNLFLNPAFIFRSEIHRTVLKAFLWAMREKLSRRKLHP